MPANRRDATALLLNAYDHEPLPSNPKETRWANAVAWARNDLREQGLLTSNSPQGVWEISAAGRLVLPVAPHEKIYRKTVFSAFSENPELVAQLNAHGITHITIIGVQSEYCIQANAHAARAAGFVVHVPRGMHSTADAQVVADVHAALVAAGFSSP